MPHAMAQRRAGRLGAAVLPDDGIADRLSGRAVPDQRGLALIGDADRGDVARVEPGLVQRLARGGELAFPDLDRVVLDPARLRIDLPELALSHRDAAAV